MTRLKKPAASGWVCVGRQLFELGQQFALAFGQVLRRFDHDLNVHVAGLFRAQHRHALCRDSRKRRPDWVPAGTFTSALLPSMVGTSNSPPSAAATIEIGTRQCRSAPSRWKNSCGGERQENIEIARRAAAQAGLAFAGEPDAGAVLDARPGC